MILIIKGIISFILAALILLFGVGATIINYEKTIVEKREKLNGAVN
ncbi:MAG: hypothetical protein IJ158_05370 [Treponema sp.]|nr:hypothetical protein [Treponema sp.]